VEPPKERERESHANLGALGRVFVPLEGVVLEVEIHELLQLLHHQPPPF
jgi:hypothetical protein